MNGNEIFADAMRQIGLRQYQAAQACGFKAGRRGTVGDILANRLEITVGCAYDLIYRMRAYKQGIVKAEKVAS